MNMRTVGSANNSFATLTWDDIETWAGTKVAARGQEYFRRGLVSDLGMTAGGVIVAWVNGSERVRKLFTQLVENGHADEVVALGKEILAAGEEQVEASDDSGETAEEITACLEIIFEALVQSPLPVTERMLWAIEVELNDHYGLCSGLSIFWHQEFSLSDWDKLACKMKEQLTEFTDSQAENVKDHPCYPRDCLTEWLVLALQKSGNLEEAIALCEREAEKTNSYTRLVRILIEQKCFQEAHQWIIKGIEKNQNPGTTGFSKTDLLFGKGSNGDVRFAG